MKKGLNQDKEDKAYLKLKGLGYEIIMSEGYIPIKHRRYEVWKDEKCLIKGESSNFLKFIKFAEEVDSKVKEIKICSRCNVNPATMQYTNSIMDFTHGFVENICQECYDKQMRKNPWYKKGKQEAIEAELAWMEKQIVSRHPIDFYNRAEYLKTELNKLKQENEKRKIDK